MIDILADEDLYWERVREGRERPLPADELEPETDWLFLDEEADAIEAEYGATVAELGEGELFEILDRYAETEGDWVSAVWDARAEGIRYTYYLPQD